MLVLFLPGLPIISNSAVTSIFSVPEADKLYTEGKFHSALYTLNKGSSVYSGFLNFFKSPHASIPPETLYAM